MTKLETYLAEIEARCEKATPGPWSNDVDWDFVCQEPFDENKKAIASDCHRLNSDFIAHARTDIPRLLAALEKAIEQRNEAYARVYNVHSSQVPTKAEDVEIEAILRGEK